jgi:hypothetical protein
MLEEKSRLNNPEGVVYRNPEQVPIYRDPALGLMKPSSTVPRRGYIRMPTPLFNPFSVSGGNGRPLLPRALPWVTLSIPFRDFCSPLLLDEPMKKPPEQNPEGVVYRNPGQVPIYRDPALGLMNHSSIVPRRGYIRMPTPLFNPFSVSGGNGRPLLPRALPWVTLSIPFRDFQDTNLPDEPLF